MNKAIKRKILGLFSNERLNPLVRVAVRPFVSLLPKSWVHAIPAMGVVGIHFRQGKRLLLKSDGRDTIATSLYWEGVEGYESETTRVFLRLLSQASTVFDVGANTGVYALLAAIDDSRREVYAFEAVPAICERLQVNALINRLGNLHVAQCAVSDSDGEITIHVTPGAVPFDSSTLAGFRDKTVPVKVEAVTLDTFVVKHGIPRVDLMKVDTEATEHLVLAGAGRVLSRDEPIIICEVLRGRTEEHLHALLDRTTYKFFLITEQGVVRKERLDGDPTYKNLNYLFIPQSKVEATLSVLGSAA